jgi:membrane protein DedA with SNARE-associated domain
VDFIAQWLGQVHLILQESQFPYLGPWSYLLLAILVAVEGPIVTLLGAAAASAGLMRPTLVFAAAALGNLAADTLWYSLGAAGKTDWILRYGRWLGLRKRHIRRLEQGMNDHAIKILVLAKLSMGFVIPTLIAAGLARVPIRRWLPALAVSETIWTGGLVLVGFFATEGLKKIETGVHYITIAGSVLFVLVVMWLIVRRQLRKEKALPEAGDMGNTEPLLIEGKIEAPAATPKTQAVKK